MKPSWTDLSPAFCLASITSRHSAEDCDGGSSQSGFLPARKQAVLSGAWAKSGLATITASTSARPITASGPVARSGGHAPGQRTWLVPHPHRRQAGGLRRKVRSNDPGMVCAHQSCVITAIRVVIFDVHLAWVGRRPCPGRAAARADSGRGPFPRSPSEPTEADARLGLPCSL